MKYGIILAALSFLLCGCGTQETFETIADEQQIPEPASERQVNLVLPEEAAAPASQSGGGILYLCDGYELTVETLAAGNLDATVRSITGYSRENLTIIRTEPGDYSRFDLVWSCAGEAGDRVGRAAVLDDGNYHYVLCLMTDARSIKVLEPTIRDVFTSFSLS